ncbi:hypothetical protein [Lentzea sp. NPDC003310]|uniref:hypothetical protein n=1 Tax=Lentzea sp. NPDC003310 TaxID=3154447 RepID=UPI00339ECA6E
MSFSASARKALDTSLPLGLRHTALRHCVWMYCPIGYHATHSFIQATVGDFTRDPSLLPAALEMLTASYNAWQTELRAYGLMRSHAKRLGQRAPHPSALNPNRRLRWYGAPREAALHAVWFWYSQGASADVDVQALAVALLERGRFTEEQREIFERVRAEPGVSWRVVQQMEVVVGA